MPRLIALLFLAVLFLGRPALAAIRVNPDGVNVNMNGATTVFLTFGGSARQRALEAQWCGELLPAAPAIGVKCNPATVFGQLPIRFDLSTPSGAGGFTDIMTLFINVVRRAKRTQPAADAFHHLSR